jgi:excinuclease ABC subunit C
LIRKVIITTPRQGSKTELIEMANKNADAHLEEIRLDELKAIMNDWNEIGSYIQKRLNLPTFPERVECFDISHIQGTNKTASMSVFINGKSIKSEYRKYRIKTIEEGVNDDFLSIEEVISRRSKKILQDRKNLIYSEKEGVKKIPDLIIIDGGKGQLSSAVKAAGKQGLNDIPIISLAKKQEEFFTQDSKNPIILPVNSPVLFFFQRIRDEAHRFAVSYHKKLREKNFIGC